MKWTAPRAAATLPDLFIHYIVLYFIFLSLFFVFHLLLLSLLASSYTGHVLFRCMSSAVHVDFFLVSFFAKLNEFTITASRETRCACACACVWWRKDSNRRILFDALLAFCKILCSVCDYIYDCVYWIRRIWARRVHAHLHTHTRRHMYVHIEYQSHMWVFLLREYASEKEIFYFARKEMNISVRSCFFLHTWWASKSMENLSLCATLTMCMASWTSIQDYSNTNNNAWRRRRRRKNYNANRIYKRQMLLDTSP